MDGGGGATPLPSQVDDADPAGRIDATPAALALLAEIMADHGPVLFHQSGGCCDGSSPMCYPRGDFRIGAGDVRLGEVAGQPFFIGGRQLAAWGRDIALTLDAVTGRGGMFSLDNGRERRFLIRGAACAGPIDDG